LLSIGIRNLYIVDIQMDYLHEENMYLTDLSQGKVTLKSRIKRLLKINEFEGIAYSTMVNNRLV
jgi:hypothetical protein